MSVPVHPEGALLRTACLAPRVSIEALAPPGTVLVLSPHPDDETLGCGMAMAAAAAAGRRIAIAMLTDGEASHPGSTDYPPETLARLRARELDAALAFLMPGVSIAVVRLCEPDGRSGGGDASRDRLMRFARDVDATAIWTTWAGDPHCDHVTAARLGRDVVRELSLSFKTFAVWGRFGERPVPPHLTVFSRADLIMRKRQAIAAYRSQIEAGFIDDSNGFIMPPNLVEHFATHPEIFVDG